MANPTTMAPEKQMSSMEPTMGLPRARMMTSSSHQHHEGQPQPRHHLKGQVQGVDDFQETVSWTPSLCPEA